jgi:hypothetical protein
MLPEKLHQENGSINRPPSSTVRKPSAEQQRKSTSRSSGGRAKSTRPLREAIRSAVPDTAIISIAKRPDQGGTGIYSFESNWSLKIVSLLQAGHELKLYTNHFKCNIPQTLKCHQYDIELEAANRDGTWRIAKKDDRFFILKKIIEREQFPFVWYDEGKSLYSIELLVGFKNQYEILIKDKKSNREQKYRLLLIKLVKSYDIQVGFYWFSSKEKKQNLF